MSSLHKRTGSPYWWAKFRDESGTTRFRSTKQAKRDEAMRVLVTWLKGAEAAHAGELTKATVLKTLNEMLERTTGERLEISTVQQFLTDWLKNKTTTGKTHVLFPGFG
jgi:hypothetical protein